MTNIMVMFFFILPGVTRANLAVLFYQPGKKLDNFFTRLVKKNG